MTNRSYWVAILKILSFFTLLRLMSDKLSAQVVGRELLAQYTKQYEEKPLFGLLQNWAESVGDKLRTMYVLLRPSSSSVFSGLS